VALHRVAAALAQRRELLLGLDASATTDTPSERASSMTDVTIESSSAS